MPSFDSLIHGRIAERLAEAAELAARKYSAEQSDFEARILEIPAIYMTALWLHGPRDIFIPFLEGGTKDTLLLQEDPAFLARVVQTATVKKRQSSLRRREYMSNTANEVAFQQSLAELVKAAQRLNEVAGQIGKINLSRAAPARSPGLGASPVPRS